MKFKISQTYLHLIYKLIKELKVKGKSSEILAFCLPKVIRYGHFNCDTC